MWNLPGRTLDLSLYLLFLDMWQVHSWHTSSWAFHADREEGQYNKFLRSLYYVYCKESRKFIDLSTAYTVYLLKLTPEAEFLDVIGTKVFRVFLLAIFTVTSANGFYSPFSYTYYPCIISTLAYSTMIRIRINLKVHKNENFFGFDFEFCPISLLVMHK